MAQQVLITGQPMDGEADALRRELLPLVPAAATVCGPDSSLFRLLCRAVFAPPTDPTAEIKTLRLARFAVDAAAPDIQRRLAAWPHSSCCPATLGATHDHQTQGSATRLSSQPSEQPALDAAASPGKGNAHTRQRTEGDRRHRLMT